MSAGPRGSRAAGVASGLRVERLYVPDRDAMVAALRAVLGLPRPLPTERRNSPND